jgi:hypothetical protein
MLDGKTEYLVGGRAPNRGLIPDLDDLRNLMRYAYRNPDDARQRGKRASEVVRSGHTWKRAAAAVAERLLSLAC